MKKSELFGFYLTLIEYKKSFMKLFSVISLIALFSFSDLCAQEQKVETIKYEQLHEKINQNNDKVVVVNFWATWFAPCVEEIPAFVEVNNLYKDHPNFKMLFVSLDRPKVIGKVKQFIQDYKMNAEVVLLDDTKRMNEWIPSFDSKWAGNIPVTIIYHNGKKVVFHDQQMTKYELEDAITEYLE